MKTFTVSAIAFYFFYVLNGLMAPGHAHRMNSACQDAIAAVQAGIKTDLPGGCKREALASNQVAIAPAN